MRRRNGLFSVTALAALVLAGALQGCPGSSDGGGFRILLRGGNGTDGDGGNGNYFEAFAYGGSVRILAGGSVNASFSVSDYRPYLGDNPLTISTNTTLDLGDELTFNSNTLDGDDGSTPATGLWVKPGVTLTIEPNDDESGDGTLADRVELGFPDGVIIEGTVVIAHRDDSAQGAADGADTANFRLDAYNVLVTGRILTGGDDNAAGTDGGDAGYVDINNDQTVVVRGLIDAAGGSGDNGGDGGDIVLTAAYYSVHVTGNLDASGGRGLDGAGGDAGVIYIYADANDTGCACSSGQVIARGGDGTDGGGDGGDVEFDNEDSGAVLVSGRVDTSGGNATVDGGGGDAGSLEFTTDTGQVRVTATLTSRGGNAAGSSGNNGGFGGYVYFETDSDEELYNEYSQAGIFVASPLIDASGGNGDNDGGNAGYVSVYNNGNEGDGNFYGPEDIVFAGYGLIDGSGGNGGVDGGDAGSTNYLETYDDSYDWNGDYYLGSVVNEASWIFRGGMGGTGTGGSGSDLYFDTNDTDSGGSYPPFDQSVISRGNIDLSAGDGDTGGYGGYVFMYAVKELSVTGNIDISGGDGTSGGGDNCNELNLYSDDLLSYRGSIFANGGAGTSGGGADGCDIYIYGRRTEFAGRIESKGGNGTSSAGDGGDVEIWNGEAGSISGSASVAGGSAGTDGDVGTIEIDGVYLDVGTAGNVNL